MMEQRNFEVRFLEGRVRRLEREIAKLREQGERLLDKTLELGTDNTKLRKLVRDMFRDFANADNELKRDQGRTFMAVTRYAPRMRELGVDDVLRTE